MNSIGPILMSAAHHTKHMYKRDDSVVMASPRRTYCDRRTTRTATSFMPEDIVGAA